MILLGMVFHRELADAKRIVMREYVLNLSSVVVSREKLHKPSRTQGLFSTSSLRRRRRRRRSRHSWS